MQQWHSGTETWWNGATFTCWNSGRVAVGTHLNTGTMA